MPIDAVDLSLRQFSGAWRLMCEGTSDYAREEADGLECVFSGVAVAFFNAGLVTAREVSADALAALGRRACAFAATRNVPWLFITTAETLAPGVDASAALDAAGLAPIMNLTGMVADRVAPAPARPDGLDLSTPADPASCAALVDVNSAAYAMDLGPAKAIMGQPSFWAPHFVVLGRVNGQPASTSAVFMVEGYRYVALVATDPGHQRRGYAEAAMRRSLELAAQAHGEQPTFLHGTDAGRPVYERMGYRAVATHGVFIEKRFLEGH
jgi:GNAT superfamily N-acetyltransferase